jgi:hypothetical protein
MKKIIISPYSRKLRSGYMNPKNYPYWRMVVEILRRHRHIHTIQIGQKNESLIRADELITNCSLEGLRIHLNECDAWASVDNFWHHFCALYNKTKPGVVVWGKSDPLIFGYPWNTNLLKSRTCLRNKQFDIWEAEKFDPSIFIEPEIVAEAIINHL